MRRRTKLDGGGAGVLLTAALILVGCAAGTASAGPDRTATPTPSATTDAPVSAIDVAEGEQAEPVVVSVDGGDAGGASLSARSRSRPAQAPVSTAITASSSAWWSRGS